jgi:hypothetical protein
MPDAIALGRGPSHVVCAFAAESGLVLTQMKVEEKSNEIVALPQIIRMLDLQDCVASPLDTRRRHGRGHQPRLVSATARRTSPSSARSSSICSAETRNRREVSSPGSNELPGTTTTYWNFSPWVDAIALSSKTVRGSNSRSPLWGNSVAEEVVFPTRYPKNHVACPPSPSILELGRMNDDFCQCWIWTRCGRWWVWITLGA